MMNRLLTLIAVLALLPLGLSAQMDKYCSDYSFAQREGTEDVACEYFSHIATRSDTIYVLLYTPAWSPRLETPLPSFRSQLRRADPDAELVLLSVGRTADVAKKHNKRMGYAADYYMYDDVDAYRSFLSIETGYPIGSLVMKVDKASGRVLWSGCPIYFIPEFFADLVNVSDPQPFMSYASDLTGEEFPLPADLRDADLSYLAYELHTDDSLFAMIHTERLPVLRGGMLVYADEFCPGFSCFRYDSVYGRFEFVKSLEPVGDERYAYVRLPEDEWQKPYVRNLLLYPKLSPMFLPDGNLGLGYDLPEVIRIDSTNIGQSNFPAILVRDARTLEPLPMIRLSDDFFDDLNDYLYKFYNIDVIDDERMILGLSVMGYPIDGYEEFTGDPARDPFVDAFYDDGKPYLQLVDKRTGEKLERFAPLPDVCHETMTGYALLGHCAASDGRQVAYTDCISGEIRLADNDRLWDVCRTYKAFDLDSSRLPEIDESKYYTHDYMTAYTSYFCRTIKGMKLTGDKIHVLLSVAYSYDRTLKESVYEYRRIDRATGEVEAAYRLAKQYDDETLLVAGLSDDVEPRLFYLSERGGRYYVTMVAEE